ncbi:hypothetical protein ISS96_02080 [Candidatus Bathyarchaeota archaeon]|nr:hypothetical protein [Candidatus Bathyarchaeota archaeon]
MKKFKVKVTAWKTFEVEAEDEETAKQTALTWMFNWFWDDAAIEDCDFNIEVVEEEGRGE